LHELTLLIFHQMKLITEDNFRTNSAKLLHCSFMYDNIHILASNFNEAEIHDNISILKSTAILKNMRDNGTFRRIMFERAKEEYMKNNPNVGNNLPLYNYIFTLIYDFK
jgi:hypothetical protein